MKETFHQYLSYSDSQLKEIWKSAFIVPDANVLLNVYRYSEETREQFLSIISHNKFKKRIWAPYQVILEFHKNRLSVIIDQKKPLDKIVSMVNKHYDNLKDEFTKFGIHKFHPFINKPEISNLLNEAHKSTLEKVGELSKDHPDLTSNDPLLERIQKIFSDKFGNPFTGEQLSKLYEEGKKRYAEKTPPGYLDSNKGDDTQYGDFVLWKEILEKAKESNNHVIFILDDVKEDWWLEIGGKTIGARPELRAEFNSYTSKFVHFYNSLNFFEHANKFLGTTAESSAVDELQKFQMKYPHDFSLSASALKAIKSKYSKTLKHKASEIEDSPSAEEMADWFFSHYKDPADGVPYESKEGGYQYIFGGPYDPMDVLQEEFPNADFKLIEEAADTIYSDGFEWVKQEDY